jgi:hypothetical protein
MSQTINRQLYAYETLEGFVRGEWGPSYRKIYATPYPIDEASLRRDFGDKYVDQAILTGVLSEQPPESAEG